MTLPNRKPNRLPHFDYSHYGAYFITICTKDKLCTLGRIQQGDIFHRASCLLTPTGKLVAQQIQEMEHHYSHIYIDKYVIMPNHIHMILFISENTFSSSPANSVIPSFVSTFKRFTNKKADTNLWQRSYHDHIIRNDVDYSLIWKYIDNNPEKWAEDCFYSP